MSDERILTRDHRLRFGSVHGVRIDSLDPDTVPVPSPRPAPAPEVEEPVVPIDREEEIERAREVVRSGSRLDPRGSAPPACW